MNDCIKNKIMIIRSFFINLRIFNLKIALINPIYYSYNIKIKGIYKGCIIINSKLKKGMIKLGVTEEESNLKNEKNYLYFKAEVELLFLK